MIGTSLEKVTEERDLGVVQNDLKCSKQFLKTIGIADKVFGMIRR